MCGFAGFVGYRGQTAEDVQALARRIGDTLLHRGPDDGGTWQDDAAQVAFTHRRLSIQDLSTAGHQPMASRSGRFVIAFNGEIYNHMALRAQLDDQPWRGHSDTETLLACFEAWGLERTVLACIGMFALAVWDRETRQLTLARDRAGEKPLYYGWQDGVFLFGSELKALRAHPAMGSDIDRGALALQMRHNYIPAPYSIYTGVHKLQPGHLLALDCADGIGGAQGTERTWAYWTVIDAYREGMDQRERDPEAAVSELDALLGDAVEQQMLSDVPLGAFLSGGIDSSTIVALMQARARRPVKTFTIGFDNPAYNEAEHAKAVARHLGTDHTELYVTGQQAMDLIPRLPQIYDEPFSDSSQIPTFLVSELCRRHVTVALSGDAGDELFAGYSRYPRSLAVWRSLSRRPAWLRRALSTGIRAVPPGAWTALSLPARPLLPRAYRNVGDKAHKLAETMGHRDLLGFYRSFVSQWPQPEELVLGATEPATALTARDPLFAQLDGLRQMTLADSLTYLPDDILVKVDRAAMAVSLETRVPMLDHRVIEFAAGLPQSLRMRNGQGKWILRQVLYRYVPRELVERPKMGFGIPVGDWLRGPLREWAEHLLAEARLRQQGYLDARQVRTKWQEHLSGARDWQYLLWDVLMFQAWLEANHG